MADTTLQRDRTSKKRLYALAPIPVYWIVNLPEHLIEVYTDPTGPASQPDYRQGHHYGPADEVPVMVEGREVGRLPVRDLLPWPGRHKGRSYIERLAIRLYEKYLARNRAGEWEPGQAARRIPSGASGAIAPAAR